MRFWFNSKNVTLNSPSGVTVARIFVSLICDMEKWYLDDKIIVVVIGSITVVATFENQFLIFK